MTHSTLSMPANLGAGSKVDNYVAPDPVTAVQRAFPHYTRATCEQMLKVSSPACPVMKLTEIVAALCAGGRADVAERLCLPVDIARRHVAPRLTVDLVADAQQADMAEDIAENQARSFPSVESKRRWLKALEAQHAKATEEIAALRLELGQ